MPVDQALLLYARQAEVPVLFPRADFRDVNANRVLGSYCRDRALDRLLQGVGVHASLDESGQLVVSSAPPPGSGDVEVDNEQQGGLLAALTGFFTDRGREVQRRRALPPKPEEIVITGSRTPQLTGMTAPTPVTSVSGAEIRNFKPSAITSEQLDTLPQFYSTQTAQRGGQTFIDAGGSYLNLRGLGPNRTLVLLNGSRVMPSDSFGIVNVDNFPAALLKRVDIVTGGASAAYGADAITGVVNFVLDHDFEGFEMTSTGGLTERGDGENLGFSLAAGGRIGGRLRLLGSVETQRIDQIDPDPDRLSNWRDWDMVRNPQWRPEDPPGTQPQRLTMPHVFPVTDSPQGLITTPDFRYTHYTFTDDGQDVRPYRFGDYASFSGPGATRSQAGGPEYETWRRSRNAGPMSNEVVRHSLFLRGEYALSDALSISARAMLARTESNARGRRGNPALHSIWSATIHAENPFLPEAVRVAMADEGRESIQVAKRGTVYGPGLSNYYANRHDENINEVASYVLGFEAELNENWQLSGRWQYGESTLSSSAYNILRLDNFFMALDAVPDPLTGEPVCNITRHDPSPEALRQAVAGERLPSPLSLAGIEVDSPIGPMDVQDCVPINVFGLGNVSPAARDWVEDERKQSLRTLEQDFLEVVLSGRIAEGWGAGPLTLATGLSYRAESFTQYSYPVWGERGLRNAPALGIRGIPGGFTGPGNRSLHQFSAIGAGEGDFDVSEWFLELGIPVFNLDTGQSLGSSLAFRSSDYSGHGPSQSWKLGLDLQINHALRWRFTRSRDVREPNFSERFVAGSGGAAIEDPVFNERYVITAISGPNAALGTEEANTVTTGFVYQPGFAPWARGLLVSLDWYDIDLTRAVSRLGAQYILDDCFDTGNAQSCDLVARNPDTNRVDRVVDRYFNVGSARTRGIDLEFQYVAEPALFGGLQEQFSLRGLVGYLKENASTTATGVTTDLVGQTNRPRYKANITARYALGDWGLQLQQRYIHGTRVNIDWREGVDVDDNTVASQSVTSLGLTRDGRLSSGGSWHAGFHVTNLFDREPPVVPGQFLSNSHDQYGRRYQLSLTLVF